MFGSFTCRSSGVTSKSTDQTWQVLRDFQVFVKGIHVIDAYFLICFAMKGSRDLSSFMTFEELG